jgi:hypothetical protein
VKGHERGAKNHLFLSVFGRIFVDMDGHKNIGYSMRKLLVKYLEVNVNI